MILHIATQADVQESKHRQRYRCDSLQAEGFIHCCKAEQLSGVVERYYADATDLLVLSINPDQLTSELVFENTVGGDELFPHVYGEINMESVIEIVSLGVQLKRLESDSGA